MKKNTVITISRQFGSGGREIGKAIAEKLKIPFYDKKIIAIAAQESGIDEELFKKEENRTSRAFYLLGTISYALGSPITIDSGMSINDRMFSIQSSIIQTLAENESCVIVGRCSDYVLKDYDNVISVFIYADEKDRITRASVEYKLAGENMADLVHKIDRERANYYNYYTGEKWGDCERYDLCINSSAFSFETTVNMIVDLFHNK